MKNVINDILHIMKTINTAITSYGMSGTIFHGPLLEAHKGFSVKKVLERHLNNSEGKHPEAHVVRNYESILVDPEIELIVVNTPDYLHYEMVKQALEAGKHVVVEKPFTLQSSEADKLIELSREKNLMLTVFQNRRWDGDFLTVIKVIKEGKLGRLVSFEAHFDRYRSYIQESWKEDSKVGAGTLYNLGSHMIDQALVLFGMPEYIFADVRKQRTGADVDDSFDIIMHYPDIKCMVRGSYLVKEQGPRYILHGTDGSFLKTGLDPQETELKAGVIPGRSDWGKDDPELYGTLTTGGDDSTIRKTIPTIPGNYMAFYDNIYEHLREGAPLGVKPEEARDVIRIIEAAYESAVNGEVKAV